MNYHGLEKFRYHVGTTTITVIMQGERPLARGIAVCSYRDTFDAKIGDELSYNRALRAAEKEGSQESLRRKKAKDEFLQAQYIYLVNSGYRYFSEYQPDLVPRELEILKKL